MPSVIILGNILDPFKISFDKNLGHRSYESFNQVHCFKIANMNWPWISIIIKNEFPRIAT